MRAFGVALGVVQEQDTAVQLPWCLSEVLRSTTHGRRALAVSGPRSTAALLSWLHLETEEVGPYSTICCR
jgi:hypothetical protein